AGDLRHPEHEAEDDGDQKAHERELRYPGQAHVAADVQEPLRAAVILDRDGEPRLRPDPPIHLDVPAVPAGVDRDQILPRDQELHERREKRLLLVAVLAPVADDEPPAEEVEARRLARPLELDLPDLAEAAEPPEVALEPADERSEVGEQGDQRARPDAVEARIDARAGRRRRGERERYPA